MLTGVGRTDAGDRQKTFETALRHAKAEANEVRDMLDVASDGVVVLDRDANVHSINHGAEYCGRQLGPQLRWQFHRSLAARLTRQGSPTIHSRWESLQVRRVPTV